MTGSINQQERLSSALKTEEIYTRAELSTRFAIKDSTLKNGIFKPKDFDSVLIFITANKTSDRPQYKDVYDGETLSMEGQPRGRTDRLLHSHKEMDLELLLFYRLSKNEHAGAGFRFEGQFECISYEPGNPKQGKPARFRLHKRNKRSPK